MQYPSIEDAEAIRAEVAAVRAALNLEPSQHMDARVARSLGLPSMADIRAKWLLRGVSSGQFDAIIYNRAYRSRPPLHEGLKSHERRDFILTLAECCWSMAEIAKVCGSSFVTIRRVLLSSGYDPAVLTRRKRRFHDGLSLYAAAEREGLRPHRGRQVNRWLTLAYTNLLPLVERHEARVRAAHRQSSKTRSGVR